MYPEWWKNVLAIAFLLAVAIGALWQVAPWAPRWIYEGVYDVVTDAPPPDEGRYILSDGRVIVGCRQNFEDRPCKDSIVHAFFTDRYLRTDHIFPIDVTHLPNPIVNPMASLLFQPETFPAYCAREGFASFDAWRERMLAAAPRESIYVTAVDWTRPWERCAFAAQVAQGEDAEIFVFWKNGRVIGRSKCSTGNAAPNPTCNFDVFIQDGSISFSFGPFDAINLRAVIQQMSRIMDDFWVNIELPPSPRLKNWRVFVGEIVFSDIARRRLEHMEKETQ